MSSLYKHLMRGKHALIITIIMISLGVACGSSPGPALMSPDDYLDVIIGDPFHLTYYSDIARYMNYLSENSDRVKTRIYGESTLGKPLILTVISSEENLDNLDRLIELNYSLADPRKVDSEEVDGLIEEARLFLWIECNIHSNEPAGAEVALEIAHELATTDDPEKLRAMEDVVLTIIPSTEPDGHDHFTEWFHTYKHTGLVRTDPPIYGAYVGHDNNRDRFNQELKELEAWARLWLEIKPAISVDVHQSRTPYVFFVPPGRDPTYPEISPVIEASWKMIGGHIMAEMYAAEMPGVTSNVVFDMWYPGYGDTWPSLHHSIGMTFEIWTGFISGPSDYDGWSTYAETEDLRYSERDSNTPWPWPGGWWTLRDQIDYGKEAIYSLLSLAGERKAFFLRNRYSMAETQISSGLSEAPFAWVIPSEQPDHATARILVEKLLKNGVEVHESLEEFSAEGRSFPAGSFVVFMSQPYGNFAKALLEIQTYPEGIWPYDVTAWTLPIMIGAEAIMINDDTILSLECSRVEEAIFTSGQGVFGLNEETEAYLLKRDSLYTTRALNFLSALEEQVSVILEPFDFGSVQAREGDFLIPHSEGLDLEELAEELCLKFYAVSANDMEYISKEAFALPRIALYHAWLDLREEGWTRLVLEDHWFSFERLSNAALLEGNLADLYDVIVMPDVRKWAAVSGYAQGTYPDPYAGGIGEEGISILIEFVEEGGRLITIGRINDIIFDDFDAGISAVETSNAFHVPGSILKIELSQGHFETLYYLDKSSAAIMFKTGYTAIEVYSEHVLTLARFAADCVMSGWGEGIEEIEGKTSVALVPYGRGDIVVFGFDPTYRHQVKNTFPLFFDSIIGAGVPR